MDRPEPQSEGKQPLLASFAGGALHQQYGRPAWQTARVRPVWIKLPMYLVGFLGLLATLALAVFRARVLLPSMELAPSRKAIVMAGMVGLDVTWLSDVPDWEIFNYVSDDPGAALYVPRNQGREAMVYLTYIIDHYDDLPDHVVFIHGHQRSWHQPQPMSWMLRALNLTTVDKEGYVNLKCTPWGRCVRGPISNALTDESDTYRMFRGYHGFVFRPEDPWYQPLPTQITGGCCAQFAVSKATILAQPLEFWQRLRLPMIRDLEAEFGAWDPDPTTDIDWSWYVGNVFELSWHWLFGKEAVHCISEEWCEAEVFGNKIECDRKIDNSVNLKVAHEEYMNINCTFKDLS